MATTRINAVSATATAYAGDDYLPLDGNNNGTRNILITSLFTSPSAIGSITPAQGSFTSLSDTIGDVRIVPQNSQSTSYTLVITDAGKHILHPSSDATSRTFTIPSNSSIPWSLGTAVTFVNEQAAGDISIAIDTDTMRWSPTGSTGTRTLTANGVATVLKIGSNNWLISGTGLT